MSALRCEFLWIVRVEFWLPLEEIQHLFDVVNTSRVSADVDLGTVLHDWMNEPAHGQVLDPAQVAAIVALLTARSGHPMLLKIFTEALRIMRETPEVRR